MCLNQNKSKSQQMIKNSFSIKYSAIPFITKNTVVCQYYEHLEGNLSFTTHKNLNYHLPPASRNLFIYGHGQFSSTKTHDTPFHPKNISLTTVKDDSYLLCESDTLISKNILQNSTIQRLLNSVFKNQKETSYSIKLIPFKDEQAHINFVFAGCYQGPLSRFNTNHLKKNEIYITNTGNHLIDSFQSCFLKGHKSVPIEKLSNKLNGVIFDSYPRASILDSNYLSYYQKYLINGHDAIFTDNDNSEYSERESIDNIIIKPRTWTVKHNDLSNTIFSDDWVVKYNFPARVQLNFFGGQIIFETLDKSNFLLTIKKCLKLSLKKIEIFYFQEILTNNQMTPCEIVIGYECEKRSN
jgi:hypothetical protein